jgi:hypothetical protein
MTVAPASSFEAFPIAPNACPVGLRLAESLVLQALPIASAQQH